MKSSITYNQFVDTVKQHLEIAGDAHMAIQKFKKLIKDHLDPSCVDMDLENTPIYLSEIDHHLHPQIQEHLTDYFALRQKQHQVFGHVTELIFKLSSEFSEMTQTQFQKHLIDNKIPVYLVPVVPSQTTINLEHDDMQTYMWGNKQQKYKLAIILTPNKKYRTEALLKYGFDSIEEIEPYLEMAGFVTV
jgi:hypothetical protein